MTAERSSRIRRRSRPGQGLLPALGAALLAVAISACDPGAESPSATVPEDLRREPELVDTPLPESSAEDLWLPYQFEALTLVEPPWPAETAQELHGVFLGAVAAEHVLEFSAVDAEGALLWSVERPESCTGFALATTSSDQDVAVLTDSTDPTDPASSTASAYDLHTGDPLWGPVPVPGPHVGPGLVFAAQSASPDQRGDTVVLDADTGDRVGIPDGAQIVGDYGDVVVVADEEHLRALELGEEGVRWQRPLQELDASAGELAAVAGADPGEGVALVDAGADQRVLIDLTDGTVLADGLQDAATDPATGARVLLGEGGMHGLDPGGERTWTAATSSDATIVSVGGALVYLLEDGAVRVHNVLTGEVAVGYDAAGSGTIAVPSLIGPTGAAVLTAGEEPVLATTRAPQPDDAQESG